MAHFETTRPAPFGAISAFKFVSAFEAVLANLQAWRSAAATDETLRALSDRQLDDIGVHRGQIEDIAWKYSQR